MGGIYSLSTPHRLFEKLVRAFTEFCNSPSEDGIFEVIFPLYHLREWIFPGDFKSYKNKPETSRTREEQLHAYLYAMPEYQIIRDLCNSAKHYNNDGLDDRTRVYKGLRVGHGMAGDSLGITHYTVDGKEIRKIFWPVYQVYFVYFHQP